MNLAEIAKNVSASVRNRIDAVSSNDGARLIFPASLQQKPVPFISFQATSGNKAAAKPIFLPMPPGLTFGDNMSYSTLDLGIIGTIASETIKKVENSSDTSMAGIVGSAVGGLAGSIVNKARKFNAAAAASIIAKNIPSSGNLSDVIDFTSKQVIAPNTNSSFQNSGVRQFSFTFKLVSKTKKEADVIDGIVNNFRLGMYPKGNDVVLAYPYTWNIEFYNADGSQNKFIPKIYSCYLTSLTSTYNGSTNLFHEDGSPIETDVGVSFQETRALTREDIEELKA